MKFKETIPTSVFRPEVKQDIDRIAGLWKECRQQFGSKGSFLFGAFTLADAMYAPVVSRFKTYGVALDPIGQAYVDVMWKIPAMQEWFAAAGAESFKMARYEKK